MTTDTEAGCLPRALDPDRNWGSLLADAGEPGELDGVEVPDHLGGDAHPAGGGDPGVGVDGVAGVVRRQGDHGEVVLDEHGGLDTPMTEPVERVGGRVEAAGDEAAS